MDVLTATRANDHAALSSAVAFAMHARTHTHAYTHAYTGTQDKVSTARGDTTHTCHAPSDESRLEKVATSLNEARAADAAAPEAHALRRHWL